ncbi:hypothetical protein ABC345_21060 [Shouchella sp. 1P09AA]|uniref:hypothetical protein n=1 Tax=unclassified Shouchella TaxID=2893065 RepID=UPI00399F3B32
MEKIGERQKRSDKKQDCKPFISLSFYSSLANVSRLTERPIKDVGETILLQGLNNLTMLEHFENHFVFDYWHGETVFLGRKHTNGQHRLVRTGEMRRLNLRFSQDVYLQLKKFAYALDRSIANTASQLLEVTFFSSNAVHHYVETHIVRHLNHEQRAQLQELLHYINAHHPHVDQSITVYGLLEWIDHVKRGAGDLKGAIRQFLEKYYS